MKKLYTLLFILAFGFYANAQLSGTLLIPGDYGTIASAVSVLNVQGVGAGGVTFKVAGGHTETSNIVINILANQPTTANRIVFQKNTAIPGANPLVSAAPGVGILDGVIVLSGTDYITFDGIDVADPLSNIGSAPMMEWGYALLRASATDGCQNVLITNCNITLQKINTASVGIYMANRDVAGNLIAATTEEGKNSFNTFHGNNISNVYKGIVLIAPTNTRDTSNAVGDLRALPNSITNFAGSTVSAEGIRCEGQGDLKVINNIINGGTGTTTTLYGILVTSSGTSSQTVASYEIANNTVTVSTSQTGNSFYAIRALGTGETVRIHHNTVENCTAPSATTNSFFGLVYDPVATVATSRGFVYNNIIRNNTLQGTGTMNLLDVSGTHTTDSIAANLVYGNQKTGVSGSMFCIQTGSGNIKSESNEVYNNSIPNSSGTGTSIIYGYYNNSNAAITDSVVKNKIYGLTIGGTSSSTTTAVYGINSVPTSSNATDKTFARNEIHDLTTSVGNVYGINNTYGAAVKLEANRIYSLQTNSSVATALAAGVNFTGTLASSMTATIFNNMISNITAPNSTNANGVQGIGSTVSGVGTSFNIYYNSINLSAAGGTTFGSSGISIVANGTTTIATATLNNNIVQNLSTPGSVSGYAVALRRNAVTPTLGNYTTVSDYNNYYTGTPVARRGIYFDGTNFDQTLADFKTRVAPREANSVSVAVNFTDPATGDLHLAGASTTDPNLQGQAIAGITSDFDNQPRSAVPFMGADEILAPAPVTLVYFKGYRQNAVHVLTWKSECTGTENSFTIERSGDGRTFAAIGQVNAEDCNSPFNFIDNNPLNGINYYRLKMRDEADKLTYSFIIAILNKANGLEIIGLNPTLVTGGVAHLNLTSVKAENILITISDVKGRTLAKMTRLVESGSNILQLDLSGLPGGQYFLTGRLADGYHKTVKFVKQ